MTFMKEIRTIVVTGGPCGGKSTAMGWIQQAFSKLGYTVLFVPETATELISGGVAPWTCGTNLEYQRCQIRLQLEKEKVFRQAAMTMPSDKLLIVCDRGMLDNLAYMTGEEFSLVLREEGLTAQEVMARYDAVFHLVSAAKGMVEFYTLGNNSARTETPEQAAALDDKVRTAWYGHPNLYIIDNCDGFDHKMEHLVQAIAEALGAAAAV